MLSKTIRYSAFGALIGILGSLEHLIVSTTFFQ